MSFGIFISLSKELPNGLRYPLVGGTRQRHFAGTHLKPRKPPENVPTPTRRVHAVLGSFWGLRQLPFYSSNTTLFHFTFSTSIKFP